ncbi:hypothetical protein RFI_05951 [Reticulomyxa filosa]|uniref:Uncharacterized protein n=1 Tax=Reticulomyxa filosa TaxID=46433 RepID=X6NZ56_RETFI|nr:hypothetical protein RFI_05951 [Reticulomyxa filosa]|eukprot:ETO31168.1 hypothetical protein RFI_05951 [Reticulomyxa filosa]
MESESRVIVIEQLISRLMKQMEMHLNHLSLPHSSTSSHSTSEDANKETGGCKGNHETNNFTCQHRLNLPNTMTNATSSSRETATTSDDVNMDTLVYCCDFQTNLLIYLPHFLYWAFMCPFEDVVERCRGVLHKLEQHLNIPISNVEPPIPIPSLYLNIITGDASTKLDVNYFALPYKADKTSQRLFQKTFVVFGQLNFFFKKKNKK